MNKKFKNIVSYGEAKKFIEKRNNGVTLSKFLLDIGEYIDEQEVAYILSLFDNAKNSAVRKALHEHVLGTMKMVYSNEQREVSYPEKGKVIETYVQFVDLNFCSEKYFVASEFWDLEDNYEKDYDILKSYTFEDIK